MATKIRERYPEFRGFNFPSGLLASAFGTSAISQYSPNKSKFFHDFCQIGALLTDEACCIRHLKTLNAGMIAQVKNEISKLSSKLRRIFHAKGYEREVNRTFEQLSNLSRLVNVRPTMSDYTSTSVREMLSPLGTLAEWRHATGALDFRGILSKVLFEAEVMWGFNIGEGGARPIPTLSGFLHPDNFIQDLLAQGRHFKDPGASMSHGEYTHRIQWWIICQEHYNGGTYRLKNAPIDVFKILGKHVTKHWKAEMGEYADFLPESMVMRTMWDQLVDSVPGDFPEANSTPNTDSFQSPHNLNYFIMKPENRRLFPLLHNFLVTRYNRRAWDTVLGVKGELYMHQALIDKWHYRKEQFESTDTDLVGIIDMLIGTSGKIVETPRAYLKWD